MSFLVSMAPHVYVSNVYASDEDCGPIDDEDLSMSPAEQSISVLKREGFGCRIVLNYVYSAFLSRLKNDLAVARDPTLS